MIVATTAITAKTPNTTLTAHRSYGNATGCQIWPPAASSP